MALAQLVTTDVMIRLVVALCLGALLGLEREIRECPAGLKTNALVCMGACVFALVSIGLTGPGVDISRIAGQVVVGIGFIGGGVIFTEKSKVIGLTTAATLWVAAGVGLLAAVGEFLICTAVVILALLVLRGGTVLEKYLIHKGHIKCRWKQ